jgi:hypothetical protein
MITKKKNYRAIIFLHLQQYMTGGEGNVLSERKMLSSV